MKNCFRRLFGAYS